MRLGCATGFAPPRRNRPPRRSTRRATGDWRGGHDGRRTAFGIRHSAHEARHAMLRERTAPPAPKKWARELARAIREHQNVDADHDERAGAPPERTPNIDAILRGADVLALDVLMKASHRGIAAPRRRRVIGCGDRTFAKDTTPALTTIRSTASASSRRRRRSNGSNGPSGSSSGTARSRQASRHAYMRRRCRPNGVAL
ncbi:substrate-binding domain-containing protein [Burkholderia oklahomensis]|uniref:substrate-binding domain-containing protein n=1 Tax=Burkholderia oklahomensis TaxID=342113 RepID=UPI00264F4C8E|nr:substrate-binding domain-containing protein [Burkholderia oklahomensis]MDN7674868.1 substrate-binding domain-containing protein [Burkholderia oklahomensis]